MDGVRSTVLVLATVATGLTAGAALDRGGVRAAPAGPGRSSQATDNLLKRW